MSPLFCVGVTLKMPVTATTLKYTVCVPPTFLRHPLCTARIRHDGHLANIADDGCSQDGGGSGGEDRGAGGERGSSAVAEVAETGVVVAGRRDARDRCTVARRQVVLDHFLHTHTLGVIGVAEYATKQRRANRK